MINICGARSLGNLVKKLSDTQNQDRRHREQETVDREPVVISNDGNAGKTNTHGPELP